MEEVFKEGFIGYFLGEFGILVIDIFRRDKGGDFSFYFYYC